MDIVKDRLDYLREQFLNQEDQGLIDDEQLEAALDIVKKAEFDIRMQIIQISKPDIWTPAFLGLFVGVFVAFAFF
jgi:hypothetical protein